MRGQHVREHAGRVERRSELEGHVWPRVRKLWMLRGFIGAGEQRRWTVAFSPRGFDAPVPNRILLPTWMYVEITPQEL